MEKLDLKGKTCPVPVIETKKLLENRQVNEIEVVVIIPLPVRMCAFPGITGYSTTVLQDGNFTGSRLPARGQHSDREGRRTKEGPRLRRHRDHGKRGRRARRILMRSFLNTLKELEIRPWRVIFLNAGVRNVTADSEYLGILKEIEELAWRSSHAERASIIFILRIRLRWGG
jgi:hypothetical protein